MIAIYQIGGDGVWTGASRSIEPAQGIATGWTTTAPPDLVDDNAALWSGGSWQIVPKAQIEAMMLERRRAELLAAVNVERDRRMRLPFTFAGHPFDYDDASQKRITGAAALAGFALTLGGKLPGDMVWHGGDTPFTWIAADNALIQMDAPTTFALGQAAAAWESAHIFAARALKDAIVAADAEDLDQIDIADGWPA